MKHSQSPITTIKFPGLAGGHQPIDTSDAITTFVSHNDIALNFLSNGWMRVLVATGYRYELQPEQLVVFWGAVPHKVEAYAPGTMVQWMVLPLGTYLNWAIQPHFTRQLVRGRVFFEMNPNEAPHDLALLERWREMIFSHTPEARTIVLLELEARLRRLALFSPAPRRPPRIALRDSGPGAERMLLLIAEHFREELSAADVAAAVGLHPGYASGLFKRHVGMGITEYITECRVSHAKALLATSNLKVLDVARDSGFGSVSQFHAVFQKCCGCTPRAFRTSLREGKA